MIPRRLAVLVAAATACSATIARAQESDAQLSAAVAERLARAADLAAPDASAPEPALRAAAALLDLARQARPDEVRFARASADALLRLGERERAIAALLAVRGLDAKDQLAQIQFVDLTLAGMETAEQRQAYAQQVADAAGVPNEVRSHAAVQLAQLLLQRAQDGQAIAAVDQSLKLNPENATALEMKYRSVAGARPLDRVRALARLIEVAPGDPRHLVTLAQESLVAGDFQGAATSYELAFRLIDNDAEGPPPVDDVVDAVGAEMVAGMTDAAQRNLDRARATWPGEARIYALSLLLAQVAGVSDADLKSGIDAARGVYLSNLAGMSGLIRDPSSKAWPATRPAPEMPDVAADAAALAADDPYRLASPYAVALGELTWFDAYFNAAPIDDARLAALRTLLGDVDPLVVRCEGWRLLNAGNVEEAKVKFSAIADRDGFGKLGLAAAARAQNDPATAERLVNEVIAQRPTGAFAAHAAAAAARAGLKPTPTKDVPPDLATTAAAARDAVVRAAVAARDAYLLIAEPVNGVSTGYGEPILAKLTLLNVGQKPIAVGPRGLVRSAFAVDVQLRGPDAQAFPALVVGRWWGPVRLAPRQSTSQVVRLDRGELGAQLRAAPLSPITMSAYATSNPIATPRGTAPGTGGQQAEVGSVFERAASPLQVDAFRARVLETMKSGAAADRLTAAQLVAAALPGLAKADDAGSQAAREQLAPALKTMAEKDADPTVRAWAAAFAAAGDPAALARVATDRGEAGPAAALAVAIESGQARPVAEAVLAAKPGGAIAELARSAAAMPAAAAEPSR